MVLLFIIIKLTMQDTSVETSEGKKQHAYQNAAVLFLPELKDDIKEAKEENPYKLDFTTFIAEKKINLENNNARFTFDLLDYGNVYDSAKYEEFREEVKKLFMEEGVKVTWKLIEKDYDNYYYPYRKNATKGYLLKIDWSKDHTTKNNTCMIL